MKKILGLKVVLNLTIAIMLIGGLVYSLGFDVDGLKQLADAGGEKRAEKEASETAW